MISCAPLRPGLRFRNDGRLGDSQLALKIGMEQNAHGRVAPVADFEVSAAGPTLGRGIASINGCSGSPSRA